MLGDMTKRDHKLLFSRPSDGVISCLGSWQWKSDWKVSEGGQREKDLLWRWKKGLFVQEKSAASRSRKSRETDWTLP